MPKPILCIDFDGVIHSYTSPWKGADVIPDPPVPGAMRFIADAMEHFTVAVFSSRSAMPGGMAAMHSWFDRWMGEVSWRELQWPTEKPAAFVTIDDRAITFTGEWPSMEFLKSFKPWNKTVREAKDSNKKG